MEAIQIGDNITLTAVERTPSELWRMVLRIAVESPLRPRSGDDVLEGKVVLSTGRYSSKRFERTEALRTRLRLVCQQWNAILKDVGHHVAFFDHGYLKRVQLWGEASGKIRRIEATSEYYARHYPTWGHPPHASVVVVPSEDTQWVESLFISNECQTDIEYQSIMKVLNDAPRLRALEILEDDIPRQYSTNILNHQVLTRVTHLSICFRGVGYEGRLCFPAVQHLSLRLITRRANESLPEWQFPSLKSFHLDRSDHSDRQLGGKDVLEGLEHFVALHSKTITSLIVNYDTRWWRTDSPSYYSKKDFWRWFPNLRLLGTDLETLTSLTPPPFDSQFTSLAIHGRDIWGYTGIDFPLDTYIDDVLEACKILSVTRLVVTDLWEEMITCKTYKRTQTSSGWSIQFFEEAAANGIQVFDSDWIPITDPKGERFLERLREPISSGRIEATSARVGAASPRFRKSLTRRFLDKFSILTLKK